MASENKTPKDMIKSLGQLGVDLSNVKEVMINLFCVRYRQSVIQKL